MPARGLCLREFLEAAKGTPGRRSTWFRLCTKSWGGARLQQGAHCATCGGGLDGGVPLGQLIRTSLRPICLRGLGAPCSLPTPLKAWDPLGRVPVILALLHAPCRGGTLSHPTALQPTAAHRLPTTTRAMLRRRASTLHQDTPRRHARLRAQGCCLLVTATVKLLAVTSRKVYRA